MERPDAAARPSESLVTVLAERDGRLAQVGGSTASAGASASTPCASWAPRGYVVTFRQIDPLFTLDLSDPAHPRGARRAQDPRASPLPRTRSTTTTLHRHRPGGRRRGPHAGHAGLALRRLRPRRAAPHRPARARHRLVRGRVRSPRRPLVAGDAPARAAGSDVGEAGATSSRVGASTVSREPAITPVARVHHPGSSSPCAVRWWWATRSTRCRIPASRRATCARSPRAATPRSTEDPRRRRAPSAHTRLRRVAPVALAGGLIRRGGSRWSPSGWS